MRVLSLATAALSVATSLAFTIKPGDKLPAAKLHSGFPPDFVQIDEYAADKNMIIVPGYLENQDALKEAGIDEVLVYCVNDGAVMKAWEADQIGDAKYEDNIVKFMGDPAAEFTKAVGMEMTHPGPPSVGIIGRSKRFALHVVNGEVKHVAISESEDDPAGDADPTLTLYDSMLEAAKA